MLSDSSVIKIGATELRSFDIRYIINLFIKEKNCCVLVLLLFFYLSRCMDLKGFIRDGPKQELNHEEPVFVSPTVYFESEFH